MFYCSLAQPGYKYICRALHIPYISKCFYVNFFKRNHSWIQCVLRARRRQRLASETAAERERRLSQRRARDRARRAARSSPTSETRLVQMGSVERLYLQHAPAAERERRLSQRRARDRARRAARSSPTSETRLVQMGSVERLYLQHGENYLNLSAFDEL